ncbi:hypothetical protein CHCC20348_4076 [Bacillus paralicheniformis]|nr:hypothetical protein CHCC5019_4331 [Bacillus paralicheniformis]TWK41387.1 hypothetical protein CHCC20348_4076 [Bacillus paralicheniformis]
MINISVTDVQTLLYHLFSTIGVNLYYIYISFLFQQCHVLTHLVLTLVFSSI